MKPFLCKAGIQLREQVDDSFSSRSRISDGWLGDTRHSLRKSDHNPDADGKVKAIDIDAKLDESQPTVSYDLADQLKIFGSKDPKQRIAYVIHNGKIASPKKRWAWRKYEGLNPHTKHIHVSFGKGADDGSFYDIPLLGGKL